MKLSNDLKYQNFENDQTVSKQAVAQSALKTISKELLLQCQHNLEWSWEITTAKYASFKAHSGQVGWLNTFRKLRLRFLEG